MANMHCTIQTAFLCAALATSMLAYAQSQRDQNARALKPYITDKKNDPVTNANVTPGDKALNDILRFRRQVRDTIKPQLDTIYAADEALAALDRSIKGNNLADFDEARLQLARAIGGPQISMKEVQATGTGWNPSLIGGFMDYISTLFTGTPTLDTHKNMRDVINVMRALAMKRANGEIETQKKLGRMFGHSDKQLNEAFDFPELKESNNLYPHTPK